MTPVFICGHYRSGTSLLGRLLDGHSQVASSFIETKFLIHFVDGFSKNPGNAKALLDDSLLRHLNASEEDWQRVYGNLDPQAFRSTYFDALDALDSSKVTSYLNAYVASCAQLTGKSLNDMVYWTEKTPFNEQFAGEVRRLWPKAKFIHMIRDPRDMYTTIRNRSEQPLKVRTTAHNWNRSVAYGMDNLQAIGADNYLLLRYEDLAANAKEEMEKVLAFLNLSFEPIVLQPTGLNGTRDWHGNQGSKRFEGVSTSSIGKFKESCSSEEINLLEGLCKSGMKRFGYALESSPGLSDQIKVFNESAFIALKRLRQFFKGTPRGAY